MKHYKYVWKGTTSFYPGVSKISESIDTLKDNYTRIAGIEAFCMGKDGSYVNVPFGSSFGHIQVGINADGEILCDATGNFIDCPIHIIISYEKPS